MKDPVRPTTLGSEGVVYERATIGKYTHPYAQIFTY